MRGKKNGEEVGCSVTRSYFNNFRKIIALLSFKSTVLPGLIRLIVNLVVIYLTNCDGTTFPLTLFVDETISNTEAIFRRAQSEIQQFSPNVSFENFVYQSGSCEERVSDTEDVFNFFKNYYKNDYRLSMGPTCLKNFLRFANLTAQVQCFQMNIFAGYPYDHPTMIDVVTRSPINIAENIIALMKGFDWNEIGIVICDECYLSDVLASENFFSSIYSILLNNQIDVNAVVHVPKSATRQMLAAQLLEFNLKARVIFSFMGNSLFDSVEYMAAFHINNFTSEYQPVIIISKFSTTGLTLPWINDPTAVNVFDNAILMYNDVYKSDKLTSFLSEFTFSNTDEALISIQMYEAYFILGHYLYSANVDKTLFNYIRPVQTISSMGALRGPFFDININQNGQRIAGFDVAVVNKNLSTSNMIQNLGKIGISNECDDTACLRFQIDPSIYEPFRDVPLCGFKGEVCDQTGVIYAIVILMIVVLGFIVMYIALRNICQSNKGRSVKNPWLIPFQEISFIDLSNTDGSQHMSIQSLKRRMGEKTRLQSIVRTKHIATVDQTYVVVDKLIMRERVRFDRSDAIKLYNMKTNLVHDNLNNFVGFSFDKQSHIYIIWNQCFRGSLADIIFSEKTDDNTSVNNNFQGAFVRDILKGLDFLQNSSIGYHGALTTVNCMVDSHWILKLTGFGINRLLFKWKNAGHIFTLDNRPIINSAELHYYAPEIRRMMKSLMFTQNKLDAGSLTLENAKSADMYSFGVVLFEIMFSKRLVDIDDHPLEECTLISEAADSLIPLYPDVPSNDDIHPDIISLLHRCWNGIPKERPDPILARKITDAVLKMSGSLVDQMMKNLETYTFGLEHKVKEKTSALEEEQKNADELLSELLPRTIADELKQGRTVTAKTYENATILYSDIVGFTSLCSESQPMEVVALLSGMYQRFDLIISQQNGYKMETIGDAYCVAAGLPIANETEHVKSIAMIALLQRDFLHKFEIPHRKGQYLNCRWGFNSGAVFSGVIGIRAPRYACFGATVSIAAKMESSGVPDRIQMTLKSQQLIAEHYPQFNYGSRGTCKIDGIGTFLTYWLEGIIEDGQQHTEQIKQYHSHINEELEKIKKRESSSSAHSTPTPELLDKTTAARQKVFAEKLALLEAAKRDEITNRALIYDTPPSSSSGNGTSDSSPTPIIRVDSQLSTIPET